MSEPLKSNTTLTKLNLSGEQKKGTQKTSINNSLFSILITSTGNEFGDTGATSLNKALKSNTTLTKLNLSGEDKKTNTSDVCLIVHSHSYDLEQETTLEQQEQHK